MAWRRRDRPPVSRRRPSPPREAVPSAVSHSGPRGMSEEMTRRDRRGWSSRAAGAVSDCPGGNGAPSRSARGAPTTSPDPLRPDDRGTYSGRAASAAAMHRDGQVSIPGRKRQLLLGSWRRGGRSMSSVYPHDDGRTAE